MTPEQINIAIAEYCGWTNVRKLGKLRYDPVKGKRPGATYEGEGFENIPDYYHDLNAMHEAEKEMKYNGEYAEILRKMADCVGPRGGHFVPNCFGIFAIAHLTASQRAEAFLRTVGKWEEGQ